MTKAVLWPRTAVHQNHPGHWVFMAAVDVAQQSGKTKFDVCGMTIRACPSFGVHLSMCFTVGKEEVCIHLEERLLDQAHRRIWVPPLIPHLDQAPRGHPLPHKARGRRGGKRAGGGSPTPAPLQRSPEEDTGAKATRIESSPAFSTNQHPEAEGVPPVQAHACPPMPPPPHPPPLFQTQCVS